MPSAALAALLPAALGLLAEAPLPACRWDGIPYAHTAKICVDGKIWFCNSNGDWDVVGTCGRGKTPGVWEARGPVAPALARGRARG